MAYFRSTDVNAVTYTKRLRLVATVSWLTALVLVIALARIGVLTMSPYLPFLALAVGSIPIVVFWRSCHATCEACGSRMRISSGYPQIVYRCLACGAKVGTGIHPDF
jgi:DNA-directed RNA polymerase subunit RPC12/RpoP